jgi:uncharacterized phage protein gp47/JayE
MPFTRPTLQTLVTRAMADLNARLIEGDARLPVSVLNVLAYVNGGSTDGLYGYLDWQADQLLVDTCEDEILLRHASIWKVPIKEGQPAAGFGIFTGSDGAPIVVGTLMQRADNVQFQTTSDAVIAGTTATVPVVAVLGGVAGDTAPGTQLTLVSPIPNIATAVTVTDAGITDGSDAELPASLRARLLNRIQQPPQGGAAGDYVKWALEVPGVTRAWESPGELGPGTITLRFVRDNDPGGIIPDTAAVAAVQTYIDQRRPVTAELFVVAPVAAPIDFTISGLVPGSAAVKATVT